ncbi:MAG TPA: UDP-N-acetylmuramyl-tripeptide synthetase [Trueperaceae bacterium]|nr:UDP-N-acetylmuramyl-tripeptide synthetase [Trueperaceae bacterium]
MPLSSLLVAASRSGPEALADARSLLAPDPIITSVVQSHARVTHGALFVARRGASFDAHDLIGAAVAAGAVAVVGERPAGEVSVPATVPYVRVADSRRALPHLAAAFHRHPSLAMAVAGITGTDGKTTTSYLLHWLLSERYVAGLISTAGVRIGTTELPTEGHSTTPEATEVQALLDRFRDEGASHVVLESSSHGFSQHRLDAVSYRLGIFTNLSSEHLDHHKTVENYREAKATLMRRADTSIVNADDAEAEYFRAAGRHTDRSGRVIDFGVTAGSDVRIAKVSVDGPLLALSFEVSGVMLDGTLPMLGTYNAHNAAAALAAAVEFGVDPAVAMNRLASFPGVPGRMQVVQAQPFMVVVDFAHTPAALAKALAVVRPASGRLIVVIGAAGERDPGKRAGLGAAAVDGADLAVFTEEDSRSESIDEILAVMAAGAAARGAAIGRDYLLVPDRTAAIEAALSTARQGDVVMLAGKGHEATLERRHETVPWDEAALVTRLLGGL